MAEVKDVKWWRVTFVHIADNQLKRDLVCVRATDAKQAEEYALKIPRVAALNEVRIRSSEVY